MKITTLSRATMLLCGAAIASLGGGSSWAQTKDAAPATIEEVVVTAQHREQRLQEVPASISVVTGQDLLAKNAQDLRDYVTEIPGVTYGENNIGGNRVTIRGIADGIVGATDPLTGIYIDEAPVTESSAGTLDPDVYDVNRVEVLKGPQGTLYGSGSMGGTLRIITNQPNLNSFEGSVEGILNNISHGGTGGRVDGVVNVPLVSDRLALRVSAGVRNDPGWIDDAVHNNKDANWIHKRNARAQLLFAPTDNTSVTLGFLYQKSDTGLPPFDYVGQPVYTSNQAFTGHGDSEAELYSLTIKQKVGGATITSATNYIDKSSDNAFAVALSPRLIQILTGVTLGPNDSTGLDVPASLKQFTQEVRLASDGRHRVDWLVGGFYSDVKSGVGQAFDFSQAPSLAGVATGEDFLTTFDHFHTQQLAAFGELTYNITDSLSLTGGLRVFNYKADHDAQADGILNGGPTFDSTSSDKSSATEKVSLKYQVNHDHMVYAQAASGYRNGGANSAIPSSCAADLAALGYASVPGSYAPDKLWNYEIGTKNTFADGRVQLNATAFYIDWSNMQNTVGLPTCGQTFVNNAGKASSKGIEIDASFRPIDGLTVNFSASNINAKLDSVATGVVASPGDPLPFAPKWSFNANAEYDHDFNADLTGFVRGEVTYVGSRWNNFPTALTAVLLDDYTTVNGRIGVRSGRWSAGLFGTNLGDKRIVVNVIGNKYNVLRPRVVGIDLRAEF